MKVTLAFLAYNEEAVIARVLSEASAILNRDFAENDWEILVVNDGSRDQTAALCDAYAAKNRGVRVVHHNPNRGYVEATLTALRESRGDCICIFDGDGQHTAADVKRFYARICGGCDVVFGWKKQRHDERTRLVLTRGLRLAARYFLRSRLHDINAGCRAYKREHVEKLAVIKHKINFIGPELYTRARLHDLKICEMTVTHAPREGGVSSHPIKKIPGEIAQVINYLRALRSELKSAGKARRFLP